MERSSEKFQVKYPPNFLVSYQNIVDWDMDKLHKKANKTHNQETDSGCSGNVCEFLSVWFGALLNQVDRILGKLLQRFNQNLVKSFLFHLS